MYACTHVADVALQLRVEAVREAREHAPAAGEHDVAEQHLAQVRVARAQRGRDQRGDRLGQVRVRRLRAPSVCRTVCGMDGTHDELRRVREVELADGEPLGAEVVVVARRELVVPHAALERGSAAGYGLFMRYM